MKNQDIFYQMSKDDRTVYMTGYSDAFEDCMERGFFLHKEVMNIGIDHLHPEDITSAIEKEFIRSGKKIFVSASKFFVRELFQKIYDGDIEVIERENPREIEIISKKRFIPLCVEFRVQVGNSKEYCEIEEKLDLLKLGFERCYKGKYKFIGED